MRFLSDSYLRTGRKMVWEIQTSIPLSFTSIIWLIKKKRYGDYVSKNLICSFVSGPRKLWNLICTLKGVNKFDGESYFTAKKIHSNYCAFCWKRTTFFGWCPMLFYHSKILDIPVRWKRLSGVLKITCPDRGNHGSGQIINVAESPSWRIEPSGWRRQLAVNDYSLSAGSNPYTSLIER